MSYQAPRGTQDIYGEDVLNWRSVEEKIYKLCNLYGYEEIRTPIFEDTKVFKRENDSSDMVNKEMYTFTMGRDSFTLRPEGTAGVIRSFVQNKFYGSLEMPAKLFYLGPMFRHERPQKGRFRQFHQFGIENIGIKNPLADAEVIALGYNLLKQVGIKQLSVLINTLGDEESRNKYKDDLRNHFEKGIDELCPDCKRRLEQNPLRILDCKVDFDKEIVKSAPLIDDSLNKESKEYFDKVLKALEGLNIPYVIENRLVRGLDYYTDTVFEVVSTHPESGSQSTVFGGGRYDNLVSYFKGPELSGVGFAVGLERLLLFAQLEGIKLHKENELDVYVISLGDVKDKPLKIGQMCRDAGYSCEVNMVERSIKSQFKSVDRRNSKVVIIIGEDEVNNNVVNIKDIKTQNQVTVNDVDIIKQLEEFIGRR